MYDEFFDERVKNNFEMTWYRQPPWSTSTRLANPGYESALRRSNVKARKTQGVSYKGIKAQSNLNLQGTIF
jgi:hypothetical protein